MSYLSTTCPHCHVPHVSFQSVGQHVDLHNPLRVTVFFYCKHCHRGISVLVNRQGNLDLHVIDQDLARVINCKINDIQPKENGVLPEYLPEKISSLYQQADDNLRREHWDACGAMCRKILDLTAKEYSKKNKLQEKIDDMAERNLITQQLKEWSHVIRLDGNDASHDDFDQPTAESIFEFMHMFVLYMHTMPGMLKAKREQIEQPK